MELIIVVLFSLLLLLLPLTIFFTHWLLFSSKPKTQTVNHTSSVSVLPPGKMGWPLIGENLEYILMGRKGTPEKFIENRMNKYSSQVFKTSLLGEKMAIFCGSKGNKFLFSNEFTLVQSWWPHSFDVIFPDLKTSIKEESKKMKAFLPKFLKPNSLQKYIGTMDLIAKEHLNMYWDQKDSVTVLPLVKKYMFSLACRLFLSIENVDYIAMFNDQFETVSAGILSLPINFPGTAYNRAIKASMFVRKKLLEIIKQRKIDVEQNKSSTQDLLSEMLNSPDEDGLFANEVDVTSKFSAMVIASYDAPGRALTFVMKYLAELPHVYDKVLEEQTEIAMSKGKEVLLNWEDIQQMRYSWNVVNEALRFVPPLQGSFREAITDFTFEGFFIPKGWKIYWNAYSTHANPNYFPDPKRFDPSRFEGKGPAPFTFVPFGGGPRMCPGMHLARVELLVFIHNLVTRFRWEKMIPNEKFTVDPQPRPANGLPVRLLPHKS
uniref:Cytochrome P450 n=1 Tax=Aquilegia coerulea TaxID=218851 RepID=A0A1I9Q5Z5_AQUCA|nr:cytochrome P450 [Aquilegia coerulea]